MKNFIMLFILISFGLFLGCNSKEAPGALYGEVKLHGTNSNEGVEIRLKNTGLLTKSEKSGMYYIFNIPPGIYSVTAYKDGYTSKTIDNVLIESDNAVVDIDFELVKLTPPDLPSKY